MISSSTQHRTAARKVAAQLFAGLDLGAHSAKLVVTRGQGNGARIVSADFLPIPRSAWDTADTLVEHLGPWLRDHAGPWSRRFVGSLRSTLVDYESRELSANEALGNHKSYAYDTLRQVLGHGTELASCDYWTSHGANGATTLHLAWTAGAFTASLSKGLARVGWSCAAWDVPGAALARLADYQYESARSHRPIVIDVGAGDVSLVWARGGVVEYIRNRIRFAPEGAAETLAHTLGLRPRAAEVLLERWGLGVRHGDNTVNMQSVISTHLGAWLEQLVFEIRRTLRYLQHRHGSDAVTAAIACGGGTCLRGLPDWLTNQIGLSVNLPTIPDDWQWEAAVPFAPQFAQALALTQYGPPGESP